VYEHPAVNAATPLWQIVVCLLPCSQGRRCMSILQSMPQHHCGKLLFVCFLAVKAAGA